METRKDTIWIYPEIDLDELYQDGHFKKIIQIAEENANLAMEHHLNANYEVLKKSIRMANIMTSYFERSIRNESCQALISVGKLIGCIETLEKIRYENEQNRAVFVQNQLLGTKHLDRIVQILDEYGSLSQTQMGEMLELQASTLSEALKKVRMANLVQSSPYGKYRLYTLTEEGVRYSKKLKQQKMHFLMGKSANLDIEIATKTLQKYLNDSKTRELCVGKIQANLGVMIGEGDLLSLHDSKRHDITKFTVGEIMREGNETEISIQGAKTLEINYDMFDTVVNTIKGSKK